MIFTEEKVEEIFNIDNIVLTSYEDEEPPFLEHNLKNNFVAELFDAGFSIKVWKVDIHGVVSFNAYLQSHSWDYEPIGNERDKTLSGLVDKLNSLFLYYSK